MKARTNRLQKLADAIDVAPLQQKSVQAAFAHFRATGLLPEPQRLAAAVADLALRRCPPPVACENPSEVVMRALQILVVSDEQLRRRDEGPPTVRECVFYEAVYATGMEREAARAVLWLEVQRGVDPTSPECLADRELPDHAGVGMQILGFWDRFAKPPYQRQAERLFERYRSIRERIDYDAPDWDAPFLAALEAFEATGELPDEGLVREVVLADTELQAIWQHRHGRDVAELLAQLDRAARAKGRQREAAVANIQNLVRAQITARVAP